MNRFPGIMKRKGAGGRYSLSEEQKEWFREWFPITENRLLAEAMGISESCMHRFARQFGLTKSEEGLREIMRRQAILAKKINEQNGYYDSIRGRKPSEATMEGTRRMWEEIREGKRESPYQILRKRNPERYRQLLKENGRKRSDAIRKDILRMKWGLPKKTKLRQAVMCKYTRKQTYRRWNALKRGYILASDFSEGSGHRYMIYYDDKTKRSPIFERNSEKAGFRFAEWATPP